MLISEETPTAFRSLLAAHRAFLMGIVHRLEGAWDDSSARLEDALSRALNGGNRMFEGWVRAELAQALLGRDQLVEPRHRFGRRLRFNQTAGLIDLSP
jgi:hypothetical protein